MLRLDPDQLIQHHLGVSVRDVAEGFVERQIEQLIQDQRPREFRIVLLWRHHQIAQAGDLLLEDDEERGGL